MDFKVNYTVVGAFVIGLSIAFVSIIIWLSSGHSGKSYERYLVYMNESVSGLSEDTPVKFNGVQVGYVEAIHLNPKDYKQVILLLDIDKTVPITETTVATLMAQGITGLTYIGLKAKTSEAPHLKAKSGEEYPVIKSEPSLLVKLDTMLREVGKNIENLSHSIEQVFDEKNREALASSLQNIKEISGTLAKNSKKIDTGIQSLDILLKNMAVASKDLDATMKAVKHSAQHVGGASKAIKTTMQDADIAIQTLSQQTLPVANDMIENIKTITVNLEQLTGDLKQNPSMLIRGKEPALLGPGEK